MDMTPMMERENLEMSNKLTNLERAMEKIHAGLSIIIRENRKKDSNELREVQKMLDDVLDKLDKVVTQKEKNFSP